MMFSFDLTGAGIFAAEWRQLLKFVLFLPVPKAKITCVEL